MGTLGVSRKSDLLWTLTRAAWFLRRWWIFAVGDALWGLDTMLNPGTSPWVISYASIGIGVMLTTLNLAWLNYRNPHRGCCSRGRDYPVRKDALSKFNPPWR